jgi:hypothetical protein
MKNKLSKKEEDEFYAGFKPLKRSDFPPEPERRLPRLEDVKAKCEELVEWLKTEFGYSRVTVEPPKSINVKHWVYSLWREGGKYEFTYNPFCYITKYGDIHDMAGWGQFDKIPRGNVFNETGRHCFDHHGVKYMNRGAGVYSKNPLCEKYDWKKWELNNEKA